MGIRSANLALPLDPKDCRIQELSAILADEKRIYAEWYGKAGEDGAPATWDALVAELDAALAQVAVLREALECHGDHSPDCATEDIDGSAYECDCGFDEALSTAAAILGEKEKA